jgi:hypothetical protein
MRRASERGVFRKEWEMSTGWRELRSALIAAGTLALALPGSGAQAAVVDPVGDFLPSFVGPQNGDLDVTLVDARITGPGEVRLTGTHAGAIGTTPGAAYVWGIDRGQGTAVFTTLDPPVGAGVTFDAVAVLVPGGSSFVLDLLGGGPVFLDPGAVSVSGTSISVTLTEALLPSAGFAFAGYGYNLWPRFAPGDVDPLDNTQISDFAPDASTFKAVVPLPAVLGLQLAGLAVLGVVAQRRRRVSATVG